MEPFTDEELDRLSLYEQPGNWPRAVLTLRYQAEMLRQLQADPNSSLSQSAPVLIAHFSKTENFQAAMAEAEADADFRTVLEALCHVVRIVDASLAAAEWFRKHTTDLPK